jgi:hypothetical protein
MLIYRPTIISGSGYYSGSFDGDGSRLYNIRSSSYALTASYALNGGGGGGTGAGFPFSGAAVITGSLTVSGSYVDFSDVVYITGSRLRVSKLNVLSELTASGLKYPKIDGIAGQIIETDGAGNLSFGNIDTIVENVKNVSGYTLYKGTPVHATGSGTSGNVVGVIAASASVASTMPATFILAQTLAAGAEGLGIISGLITGVNTSAFKNGEVIYVGARGGYTNVAPTGSNLVQNLGIVTKVHPTNGGGVVLGAGRANATPNLLNGQIFYGVGNKSVARPLRDVISGSAFVFSGSFKGDGSGLTNVSGEKGQKGEAVAYIYTSSLQGVVVSVNHNLDLAYPVYNIYDNLGNETIPKSFSIINNNTVEIDFGVPFTGSLTISSGDKGLKGDKGNFKGQKGEKGDNKGSKGNIGPKGNIGQKGATGNKGQKGDIGQKGSVGSTGLKGSIGEKGYKGDLGYKGEIGLKGQKGEIGASGSKGNASTVQGPKGIKGDIGPSGSKGNASSIPGPLGPKGQKGELGYKGSKGNASSVQGPSGSKGNKGDNGSLFTSPLSGSLVTLNHGLNNKYPVFVVYDITGSAIFPNSFVSVNSNTSQVSFVDTFSGSISIMSGGQKGVKGEKGEFKGEKGTKGQKGLKGEGTLYTTSISGSIVTINHNTGHLYPIFSAYNKNKIAVQPKTVLVIDSNTLQVDFGTSFSGSISVGSGGLNGLNGLKGEKGNFKGEKGTKGQKGNNGLFPFSGAASITGSLSVTNSSSFSHVLPKQNNLYDLGSSSNRWRDLYLTSASIYLGRTKITSGPNGKISFVDSQNPNQKITGNYTGSFSGSFNISGIRQGSNENKVLLLDSNNNIIYRNNLALTGSKGNKGDMGPSGSNAGIQTYTNPSNNRVITSVSSTEINAESNLTFDGSILSVNSNSAIKLPSGTTNQRPVSSSAGMIRLNSTNSSVESYISGSWHSVPSFPGLNSQVTIIGGGSRGGVGIGYFSIGSGGGGGGGGEVINLDYLLYPGSYTVIVAAGGGNSSFGNIIATSGSVGGNASVYIGGSGGAGSLTKSTGGPGGSTSGDFYPYDISFPGVGCTGLFSVCTGDTRAGGGGGGGASTANQLNGNTIYSGPGAIGSSGGGAGGDAYVNGGNGVGNTGGGGGGGGSQGAIGGNGGSGIVVIKYVGNPKATGGTISTSNGYTKHTFTMTGTLVVY